ncbi:MAG: N-acetylneuraminate synthase family protein, partial [Planctomycetes bacterium]|nr:N-acetylneuraminate synthase family protein [Planctomycetota bacterium]
GYSDHSLAESAGALAVACGACFLERHLTYDRKAIGPDHSASSDPAQFAAYVRLVRSAEAMLGTGSKRVLEIEEDVRTVSRQSLVLRDGLAAGRRVMPDDLTVQRPGTGISAADVDRVVGRTLRTGAPAGTILTWEMLDEAA